MNSAILHSLLLVLLGASCTLVSGGYFKLETIDSVYEENPYMGEWSSTIHNDTRFSLDVPVKKEMPCDTMVNVDMIHEQMGEIFIYEKPLPDALNDDVLGKRIVAHGLPSEKFPTTCPVTPNMEYKISQFNVDHEALKSLPEGKITGKFVLSIDKKPVYYLKYTATSTVDKAMIN
ncbi:uncharacterized protein LOC105702213 [Orussus abietinus]|uniref:uncharacterized protein LOC105702213 n=1 Tax=Orussus abietinus TaxID=222816 RepID=UPI000625C37B|nr:uncharacterized protein LOC105702213 [Orussus abietinus]